MAEPQPSTDTVLRGILESARDLVIFALDRSYRYLAFNRAHADTMKGIWGADIAVGQCMLDSIGREDDRVRAEANFSRALRGEVFTLVEAYGDTARERREYEDTYSPITDDSGVIIGLSVLVRDVTDARRQARELERYRQDLELLVSTRSREAEDARAALRREIEERLRVETKMQERQKLESLGNVSSGIAHDFNNVLMGILGNAELALPNPTSRSRVADHLRTIAVSAESAANLTHKVYEFSGEEQGGKRPRRPQRSHRRTATAADALRARGRAARVRPRSRHPSGRGGPNRLRQLIMNLVTNGAEACGAEVGLVRIRTGVASLPGPRALLWAVKPGDYAYIEVADNGCGMSAEVIRQDLRPVLHDPRVRPRPGTDRGPKHRAQRARHVQRAVPNPARGPASASTCPCTQPSKQPSEAPPHGHRTRTRHRDTALIADDNPRVLRAVRSMLESEGFEVIAAEDGTSALRMFHDAQAPIAVGLPRPQHARNERGPPGSSTCAKWTPTFRRSS